jgi:serine/threonine protein kinase
MNVARVLLAYTGFLAKWPYGDVQFFKKVSRPLGSNVIFHPCGLVKTYEPKTGKFTIADAERIYEIYDYIKKNSLKYAIRCVQLSKPSLQPGSTIRIAVPLEIHLEPLCAPLNFEKVEDIVHALWCVLHVLAKLHGAGFVHGDVRWSNVMYDVDMEMYRLIDFDNGGKAPMTLVHKRKLLRDFPPRDLVPIPPKEKGFLY